VLIQLFQKVRTYGVPVTIPEWLDLLEALKQQLVFADIEQFYLLARTCMVKQEAHYDRFDRAFADFWQGIATLDLASHVPKDWLTLDGIKQLTDEERARLERLGDLDALLKAFAERLKEQQERHAGGNKWIGTGGSSPFGSYGFHPEGIRLGQQGSGARKAVKVWDQRQFQSLDTDQELDNRGIKIALRQLRRFARSGAKLELDLASTIDATSRQAGLLDLKFQAERHNAVKVLLLLDIGGSMDDYVLQCRQLFAACRAEFKHLEIFYFHNCLYETVWRTTARRPADAMATEQLWHTYGADYHLILVGDATMGPYEISYPGGSVEHYNKETGEVWLKRLAQHFPKLVWLNPQPEDWWPSYPSIGIIKRLMHGRMFGWTLAGIQAAITQLKKPVVSD